MPGPRRPRRDSSTYDAFGASSGCSMFHRCAATPSRCSSLKLVTAHTSALHVPVVGQKVGRGGDLAQNCTRAKELHLRRLFVAGTGAPQEIHAAKDALARICGHRRMRVVLVHQREVIEGIFLIGKHPLEAVLNDDGELVTVGRIEAAAVGNERRRDLTLPVFVLQTFAVERRAARGRAEQEAARPAIAGCPDQVADALEAEHRVEDIEWDHRQVVIRVRRAGGDPRRKRPSLVDAFLKNLSAAYLRDTTSTVRHLADDRAGRPTSRCLAGGTCPPSRTYATRRRRSARRARRRYGRARRH